MMMILQEVIYAFVLVCLFVLPKSILAMYQSIKLNHITMHRIRSIVLCCAVLCCVVLCSSVLRCAVLRCAVLRCGALRCGAVRCVVLRKDEEMKFSSREFG